MLLYICSSLSIYIYIWHEYYNCYIDKSNNSWYYADIFVYPKGHVYSEPNDSPFHVFATLFLDSLVFITSCTGMAKTTNQIPTEPIEDHEQFLHWKQIMFNEFHYLPGVSLINNLLLFVLWKCDPHMLNSHQTVRNLRLKTGGILVVPH